MATTTGSLPTPSNIITVKILHKESGDGIANLLVDVFDLDSWADPEGGDAAVLARGVGTAVDPTAAIVNGDISILYKMGDRIGSASTDASGQCIFQVTPRDFNLPPKKTEQKPDLVLLVLAPDEPGLDLNKRLLHFARDIRLNAGSKEAYIIRLPTTLLKEKEIPVGLHREESPETAKNKVSLYVEEKQREQEFNAGAAEYHGAQLAIESQQRTDFRKDFFKKIGTNFNTVPISGVIAAPAS